MASTTTSNSNSTSNDPFDPVLSGISGVFDPSSFLDDPALTDNLAVDEDSFFPAGWDQETAPYDGNLYSTPLSWEAPAQKKEIMTPIDQPAYTTMATLSSLTQAQQARLRDIAMPPHLTYHHSPVSNSSAKSRSTSSPDAHNDHSRKRKSSAEANSDDEDDDESNPPVKKTAHNMIEKRYRTNLNDKIAALRDSVPSLRIMTKSARGEDTADDREDLQGLTPAHKLNKATVLSKATEYINHLEKRNKRLQSENAEQKARLAAFETLFRSGSMGFDPTPPMNNTMQYPHDYITPGHSPDIDPQGMIQVPEDIRRLQQAGAGGPHYAVPQQQHQFQQPRQQVGVNGWNSGYSTYGKLMVGGLASLMLMEGFRESEQTNDSPSARGLFALPTGLLRMASNALHSSLDFNLAGYHVSTAQFLGYIKLFLVLGTLLYVFVPSLFLPKPTPKNGKTQSATVVAAPSLASSIQVRRQAWLTAIQTVWVPRHNFFLEAAALMLKMVKLSTRNVIGANGYAYLTGITPQQEAARIKAWSIALDAQLAGGDIEISLSRLTLTLLASGTLPDTPARLMLKALHIRVLLWEIGNLGFHGFYMFNEVAAKLARWKWNEAKQLQQLMARTNEQQEDRLPHYLVALLDQECDEVLGNSIGQRAHNLAWNLPTTYNTHGSSEGMDGVVDDHAIRSPLDAAAAWYSSLVLQRALSKSLSSPSSDASAQTTILNDLTLAIRTAPTGSAAQIRAFVARAVLVSDKRGASIAASVQALGPLENKASKTPNLINTSASMASLPDIKMSLRCAMAIAHLERFPAPSNPEAAHKIINTVSPINLTLLGFTAEYKLMEKINAHRSVSVSCISRLENLAGGLRMWIGGKQGEKSGLEKEVRMAMVERCLEITKKIVGMVDAGYESMTDGDAGDGC